MAVIREQLKPKPHGTPLPPAQRRPAVAKVRRRVATLADGGRLIAAGEHVLIACSGGQDSLAMLDALAYLGHSRRWRLDVCHVDHQLRPGGAEEAALVAAHAAARGLGFTALKVEVGRRGSLQDEARRVRHAALRELASELGCSAIALGHTADDQAETVLMRLFTAAHPQTLAAMGLRDGPLVRPLLQVWRRETEAYCRSLDMAYVEDPSNQDFRFLRARVRHQLLPEVEKLFPGARKRLLALAAAQHSAGSSQTPC